MARAAKKGETIAESEGYALAARLSLPLCTENTVRFDDWQNRLPLERDDRPDVLLRQPIDLLQVEKSI